MTRTFWKTLNYYIEQKWFIILLIFINFFGSLYSLYWYKNQFLVTSVKWLIFVPDSPLASTFFTLFLILYLFKKKIPLIEAMAAISMFKYGVWTIVIIFWGAWEIEPSIFKIVTIQTVNWKDIVLIIFHTLMVFQAILFFKKYSFKFWSIFFVGIWLFINDYIDYTQGVHPLLPKSISSMENQIAEFTLYLTGFSLLLFYFLYLLRRKDE